MKIRPLPNRVLVTDLQFGERTLASGIILRDDDGKSHGIRGRWAKIHSVGKGIDYIHPGQWILIQHGRWTRKLNLPQTDGTNFELWGVDHVDIMMVSDTEPTDFEWVANSI